MIRVTILDSYSGDKKISFPNGEGARLMGGMLIVTNSEGKEIGIFKEWTFVEKE
jgi:hypothetical protein